MRSTTITGAFALVLALSACSGSTRTDEYAAALPDAQGLTLELRGTASEGLAPSAMLSDHAGTAVIAAPDTGDDLVMAQDALQKLNAAVVKIFTDVAEVAKTQGQELPGSVKVYGPAERCVEKDSQGSCVASAMFKLVVKKMADQLYGFALAALDPGSSRFEDVVVVGEIARGDADHRGAGKLAVNLDNLKRAAPSYHGSGLLLAGFVSGANAKAAEYRLVGFAPPGVTDPVTALFAGFKTASGLTRIRVAALEDVVAGTNTQFPRELVAMHAGWLPGAGGRAHLIVTDWKDALGNLHGDLPAGSFFYGFACWVPGAAAGDAPVLKYKAWRLCAMGGQAAGGGTMDLQSCQPPTILVGTDPATDCPTFASQPPMPMEPPDPMNGGDPAMQPPAWTDNPLPDAPADPSDPALQTTVP